MLARRLLGARGGGPLSPSEPTQFYALFNGTRDGATYALGAGERNSGVWSENASNPVLTKGSAGTWNSGGVKDPAFYWDGSQFVIFAAGYDSATTTFKIGRWTAASWTALLAGTLTPDAGNPLITVGAGGSFRDAGVRFPTVLFEPSDTGKEEKIWFGADQSGGLSSVGYAYRNTTTGAVTVVGQVLTATTSTWDEQGIYPFGIYTDGATYSLFYGGHQGTSNPQWQGGLASFTSPSGTYTKSGSNPILVPRHITSGTTQLLTVDSAAGSAIVKVADTSAWSVGEVMLIAANVESETHRILTIDSGTQITLDATLTSAFHVLNGATIRSFAYNSVVPRTVRAIVTGGYEMFGTPFQPQEDLSPGGLKLREGAFHWTASSLTGPWAYDYSGGLFWPLYPTVTSGWREFSAENPWVIPKPL